MDYSLKKFKEMGKPIAGSTIGRQLRQAKTVFNKAVDWGYIKTNPFEKISIGKIRTADWHYITPEEFQSILKEIDNYKIRKSRIKKDRIKILKQKAFHSVMYGCGLRFGEAVNLIWDSNIIDFGNSQITVKDRQGTKTLPPFFVKDYETRTIPMPSCVADPLKELKEISNDNHPYLFVNDDCFDSISARWQKMLKEGKSDEWQNRYMMSNALRQFKLYCEKAGIKTDKRLNLHCLRKGYGTNLMKIGTPANTLKDLMGHSSIITSMQFYVSSVDENKRKAVEGLDRLMG